MSRHPPRTDPAVAGPHVWSELPGDLQQRAVRLLAQLACARLRWHIQPPTQEANHGRPAHQPQDPPRSP
jgi:hypothetical protein